MLIEELARLIVLGFRMDQWIQYARTEDERRDVRLQREGVKNMIREIMAALCGEGVSSNTGKRSERLRYSNGFRAGTLQAARVVSGN